MNEQEIISKHSEPNNKIDNLGLALSGGGVRATVFHLGVLARLATNDLLENINCLSSVSGGSLGVGLIFAQNNNNWPNSKEYLEAIVPKIRLILTSVDTECWFVFWSLLPPWRIFRRRAHVLAKIIEKHWNVSGSLQDLPDTPKWLINATCYETGKNWRFSKTKMGDYIVNYVSAPEFPISKAISASAAVPALIGPLVLNTRNYNWVRANGSNIMPDKLKFKRVELWDGGVYDNLGVEALWKPDGGLKKKINFLIVSDASAPLAIKHQDIVHRFRPITRARRLIDISNDQGRSMRSRSLIWSMKKCESRGVIVRLGKTTKKIYGEKMPVLNFETLDKTRVKEAKLMETTLRRLSIEEFNRLYRHGFEVADATLCRHHPKIFTPTPATSIP